ncbi:hypothetical protein CK501_06095 [Halovibrio salipaludis]|uniref:Uncharacterized protein n=1 Tax=Halovibrio salipaludis TaxID=2032626 RepID=A0A2A2F934_9GAMM|nr:hypothetical protein [Halovibrio salipaludis]PAU81129.1 hypothetical protein CK501_06095 [Halovibrio salipaludis]
MLKNLIVFSLLIIFSLDSSAQISAKRVCQAIQENSNETLDQLPMRIDPVTTWYSIVAIYASGTCHLTYSYSINTKAAFDFYKEELGSPELSDQELKAAIESGEGKAIMKQTITKSFERMSPLLFKIKDLRIVADYEADQPLEPFQIVIKEKGQVKNLR